MREKYKQHSWHTSSLDDHIELIKRQINRSMEDPDVRQLAVQIVSGVVVWTKDPRSGLDIPVIPFKGRLYRAPTGPLCRPKDEDCEVRAIWDFAVQNIRYVLDPEDEDGSDLYMDVTTILAAGGGDCDDFTIFFATMLKSVGYQMKARVISLDGKKWAHIYPLVLLPKGQSRFQMPLDATENGKPMGWEYPRAAAARDFKV